MDIDVKTYISVLKEEIELLKSRIEPHDTGHLYTTIGTLKHRIKELEKQDDEVFVEGIYG